MGHTAPDDNDDVYKIWIINMDLYMVRGYGLGDKSAFVVHYL
jgi:hypothetical protein